MNNMTPQIILKTTVAEQRAGTCSPVFCSEGTRVSNQTPLSQKESRPPTDYMSSPNECCRNQSSNQQQKPLPLENTLCVECGTPHSNPPLSEQQDSPHSRPSLSSPIFRPSFMSPTGSAFRSPDPGELPVESQSVTSSSSASLGRNYYSPLAASYHSDDDTPTARFYVRTFPAEPSPPRSWHTTLCYQRDAKMRRWRRIQNLKRSNKHRPTLAKQRKIKSMGSANRRLSVRYIPVLDERHERKHNRLLQLVREATYERNRYISYDDPMWSEDDEDSCPYEHYQYLGDVFENEYDEELPLRPVPIRMSDDESLSEEEQRQLHQALTESLKRPFISLSDDASGTVEICEDIDSEPVPLMPPDRIEREKFLRDRIAKLSARRDKMFARSIKNAIKEQQEIKIGNRINGCPIDTSNPFEINYAKLREELDRPVISKSDPWDNYTPPSQPSDSKMPAHVFREIWTTINSISEASKAKLKAVTQGNALSTLAVDILMACLNLSSSSNVLNQATGFYFIGKALIIDTSTLSQQIWTGLTGYHPATIFCPKAERQSFGVDLLEQLSDGLSLMMTDWEAFLHCPMLEATMNFLTAMSYFGVTNVLSRQEVGGAKQIHLAFLAQCGHSLQTPGLMPHIKTAGQGIMAILKMLDLVLKSTLAYVKYGIFDFSGNLAGKHSDVHLLSAHLIGLRGSLANRVFSDEPQSVIKSYAEYKTKLGFCIEALQSAIRQNKKSVEVAAHTRTLATLVDISAEILANERGAAFREAPFVTMICGTTAQAKTVFADGITRCSCSSYKIPFNTDNVVHVNISDAYNSEIKNQSVYILDDFANPKADIVEGASTFVDKFLKWANNAPSQILSAAVEDKGKIFSQVQLMILTCFNKNFHPEVVSNQPEAIQRRVNVYYEIKIKEKYKSALGAPKIPGGNAPDAWDIDVYHPLIVGDRVKLVKMNTTPLTYLEVLCYQNYCCTNWKIMQEHIVNQNKSTDRMCIKVPYLLAGADTDCECEACKIKRPTPPSTLPYSDRGSHKFKTEADILSENNSVQISAPMRAIIPVRHRHRNGEAAPWLRRPEPDPDISVHPERQADEVENPPEMEVVDMELIDAMRASTAVEEIDAADTAFFNNASALILGTLCMLLCIPFLNLYASTAAGVACGSAFMAYSIEDDPPMLAPETWWPSSWLPFHLRRANRWIVDKALTSFLRPVLPAALLSIAITHAQQITDVTMYSPGNYKWLHFLIDAVAVMSVVLLVAFPIVRLLQAYLRASRSQPPPAPSYDPPSYLLPRLPVDMSYMSEDPRKIEEDRRKEWLLSQNDPAINRMFAEEEKINHYHSIINSAEARQFRHANPDINWEQHEKMRHIEKLNRYYQTSDVDVLKAIKESDPSLDWELHETIRLRNFPRPERNSSEEGCPSTLVDRPNPFVIPHIDKWTLSHEAETCTDTHLHSKISRNLKKVWFHGFKKDGKASKFGSHILAIGACDWLAPTHAFAEFKGTVVIVDEDIDSTILRMHVQGEFLVDHTSVVNSEFSLIRILRQAPKTSLVKFFPLEESPGGCVGRFAYCEGGKLHVGPSTVIQSRGTYTFNEGDDLTGWVHSHLPIPAVKGLCGACWVGGVGSRPFIHSFHIAGYRGEYNAMSMTVLQGDLEKAIAKLDTYLPRPAPATGSILELQMEEVAWDVPPHHFMSYLEKEPNEVLVGEVLGAVDKGVSTVRQKIRPTPIATHLQEIMDWGVTHGPVPEPNHVRHYKDAFHDILRPRGFVRGDVMIRAVADFKLQLMRGLENVDLHDELSPLEDVAAISGVDGLLSMGRLDPKTSYGWPSGGKKGRFYEDGAPHPRISKPQMWDAEHTRLLHKMEDQLEVKRVNAPFNMSVKVEPTKVGKTSARLFGACNGVFSSVTRKYYLPLCRLAALHPFLFEGFHCLNAHGDDWDKLYHYLTFSDRIVAGDYKSYDKNLTPTIMLWAFDILIDLAIRAGYNARQIKIMWGIATEISYPIYNARGLLVATAASNPSGHPLTFLINCICNSLLLRYVYYSEGPKEPPPFHQNVRLMTAGDDHIAGVSPACNWFNHFSIYTTFERLGIPYTPADKSAVFVKPFDHISEAMFVSRSFRFCPCLQRYVGPLKMQSLQKSYTCVDAEHYKNLSPLAHLTTVIAQNDRELFFHGPDQYYILGNAVREACKRHGTEMFALPTYAYWIAIFSGLAPDAGRDKSPERQADNVEGMEMGDTETETMQLEATTTGSTPSPQVFLERLALIGHFVWSESVRPTTSIYPLSQLLDTVAIRKKFDNYVNLRFTSIDIVINCTGNPFAYGMLLINWVPYPKHSLLLLDRGLVDIDNAPASQRQHVLIDASMSSTATLTVPFFWPNSWFSLTGDNSDDFGYVSVRQLNQFRTVTTSTTALTVEVSMYANMNGVELKDRTQYEAQVNVSQAGAERQATEHIEGRYSTIATNVAGAAAALTPWLGGYAKATAVAAGGAAAILRAFGLSRPRTMEPVMTLLQQPLPSTLHFNQPMNANSLGLDRMNEVAPASDLGGTADDEMNLYHIAQKWAWFNTQTWEDTNAHDVQLFAINVNPLALSYDTSLSQTYLTPIAYASANFTYWTGTIKYRLQVVCSNFHRGLLRVVYEPIRSDGVTPESYATNCVQLWDISKTRELEITVRYAQPIDFLEVGSVKSGDVVGKGNYYSTDNGRIYVTVVNRLTSPNPEAGKPVDINLWIAAGEDFRLAQPKYSHLEATAEAGDTTSGGSQEVSSSQRMAVVSDTFITVEGTPNTYLPEVTTSRSFKIPVYSDGVSPSPIYVALVRNDTGTDEFPYGVTYGGKVLDEGTSLSGIPISTKLKGLPKGLNFPVLKVTKNNLPFAITSAVTTVPPDSKLKSATLAEIHFTSSNDVAYVASRADAFSVFAGDVPLAAPSPPYWLFNNGASSRIRFIDTTDIPRFYPGNRGEKIKIQGFGWFSIWNNATLTTAPSLLAISPKLTGNSWEYLPSQDESKLENTKLYISARPSFDPGFITGDQFSYLISLTFLEPASAERQSKEEEMDTTIYWEVGHSIVPDSIFMLHFGENISHLRQILGRPTHVISTPIGRQAIDDTQTTVVKHWAAQITFLNYLFDRTYEDVDGDTAAIAPNHIQYWMAPFNSLRGSMRFTHALKNCPEATEFYAANLETDVGSFGSSVRAVYLNDSNYLTEIALGQPLWLGAHETEVAFNNTLTVDPPYYYPLRFLPASPGKQSGIATLRSKGHRVIVVGATNVAKTAANAYVKTYARASDDFTLLKWMGTPVVEGLFF